MSVLKFVVRQYFVRKLGILQLVHNSEKTLESGVGTHERRIGSSFINAKRFFVYASIESTKRQTCQLKCAVSFLLRRKKSVWVKMAGKLFLKNLWLCVQLFAWSAVGQSQSDCLHHYCGCPPFLPDNPLRQALQQSYWLTYSAWPN
jgi:hypothetical protein